MKLLEFENKEGIELVAQLPKEFVKADISNVVERIERNVLEYLNNQ